MRLSTLLGKLQLIFDNRGDMPVYFTDRDQGESSINKIVCHKEDECYIPGHEHVVFTREEKLNEEEKG